MQEDYDLEDDYEDNFDEEQEEKIIHGLKLFFFFL